MDKEWPAILVLPIFQDLPQFRFNLWQILGDALAHLLLSEQASGVPFLAFLPSSHETRRILRRGRQIIAVLDQRAVLFDHDQSRGALFLKRLEA